MYNKYSIFFLVILSSILFSSCGNINNFSNNYIDTHDEYIVEQKNSDSENTKYIDEIIDKMTIEEKVGQMFMLTWRKNIDGTDVIGINDTIKYEIDYIHPGGVILFGENIDTEEQTKKYINDMQKQSKIPLFIAIDEEGGRVSRLHYSGKIVTPNIPTALIMSKNSEPLDVEYNMSIIANEIKKLGFNVNFAPVADINTNPENTVIGDRAFGSDEKIVSEFVLHAVNGLQKNNISACLKHFPGHGDTYTDTHNEESFVNHDIERLRKIELVPFENSIKNGVDFVMVGHIKVPNVDKSNLPSSLSETMIDGILRKELNFDGIVITDALDMKAISDYYDTESVINNGIEAGVDIFLMPYEPIYAYEYLLNLVINGDIDEERINNSVRRILNIKLKRNLIKNK